MYTSCARFLFPLILPLSKRLLRFASEAQRKSLRSFLWMFFRASQKKIKKRKAALVALRLYSQEGVEICICQKFVVSLLEKVKLLKFCVMSDERGDQLLVSLSGYYKNAAVRRAGDRNKAGKVARILLQAYVDGAIHITDSGEVMVKLR